MTKNDIFTFLNQRKHAVISTCGSNGQPEAALIGFGETTNLELIFGTDKRARKYTNIKKNNRVAFVIGWEDDALSLQYEGIAEEIPPENWDTYLQLFHAKVPGAAKYQSLPEQTYFKVTPTWIRYVDLSGEEEKNIEFTF